MTEHAFSLIPFPDANIPAITIHGVVARENNILTIHYSLKGEIQNIFLPKLASEPRRKDNLWKATCFEFFLAIPDRPAYWEFNMSPSGDWNAYHMDEYRQVGLREETSIERLPFSVRQEADCISVAVALNLNPILSAETTIQVAVTSVIQTHDGHETYWALTHPNPQADFHLREGFILEMAG